MSSAGEIVGLAIGDLQHHADVLRRTPRDVCARSFRQRLHGGVADLKRSSVSRTPSWPR